MHYELSALTLSVFLFFVGSVLALSFYLGRKAKSAKGYYAAHGTIPWFVNGIAFAGDYLSAASFLGICGMIALYGYDGFLYSIGYLAGWVVALFVIAEPIKRLGKFTFADALDAKFNSRGIKLTAAISTLVVSIFYLIPQMVGAGALVKPLLGLEHWVGVLIVGVTVIIIVVTAGMVSTTWVQFIKGSLLVFFCTILVGLILHRGLNVPDRPDAQADLSRHMAAGVSRIGPYARVSRPDGGTLTFRMTQPGAITEAQTLTPRGKEPPLVNGLPQSSANDLRPIGVVARLPQGQKSTGPLGPLAFLSTLEDSTIVASAKDTIKGPDGAESSVYYPVEKKGSDLLTPGGYFKGLKSAKFTDRLDFISLMLALFCGTASLPHILIRYYTVKDAASARKSTIVGIGAIGFFYVLTLFLGLGAMTSGVLDPADAAGNMAAPLLAKSFGNLLFAIISAIAFTTVLGTVSGLIMAASGAVAHDLITNFLQIPLDDHQKVRAGKITSVVVGAVAMLLGVIFAGMNVNFLVGWAFNIAASANLPALVMLLFWKRTTKQGITAAVSVGMATSLAWILLSAQCYKDVYHLDPARSIIPFSQPGLVTIPLGFVVLIVVSLMTWKPRQAEGFPVAEAFNASKPSK
jgi:cation/acetate symporter